MKCKIRFLIFLMSFSYCFSQQRQTVDFTKIKAEVFPQNNTQTVSGTMQVMFKILKKTDSVYLDAVKMKITYISENEITVSATDKKIWLTGNFTPNTSYTVGFSYQVSPKKALYFVPNQIWTQGQGKYTSHWLPSIDDMNDKIEFDLTIVAPTDKTVISNGKLRSVTEANRLKRWQFDMQNPMSSYLVAVVIGDFTHKTITTSTGVIIELYSASKDSLKWEPTYRYTKQIFDFLETEIGVPYPWQNYKQVPVRDFLYAGMENTTATLFSEAFVVDSIGFNDRNYVAVNAHELAHQWFGNLVTETASKHHWLHEGFATYYALLAQRDIFGEDYYYWKLFNSANQLQALSDKGKGESLLNPQASSLTFYEKGAWALHILRETVGDLVFKQAVVNYLNNNKFKNVSTQDFIAEVEALYGKPLTQFTKDWLQQTAFQAEEAYRSLKKSPFINRYFALEAIRELPIVEKQTQLSKALNSNNEYLGQEAVYQLALEKFEDVKSLYIEAFNTQNLYIHQALAFSLEQVPKILQTQYETLLYDNSYLTQEAALYNLWSSFPEKRQEYLDKLKNSVGFQDKNIRQLWLALAIVTPDYEVSAKDSYGDELRSYTSGRYSFEIRQKAFEYCEQLQLINEEVLLNLSNACVHHNWRFRNFSRALLTRILENETYKELLRQNKSKLTEKVLRYLELIW